MKTASFAVQMNEKASRIELFVRIVWYIISVIVLFVFAVIVEICFVLEWLVILILGKRNEALNGVLKAYLSYVVQFDAYLLLLTDERSPLIPSGSITMKSVSFRATSATQASRLELFVRILWGLLTSLVLAVLGIVMWICLIPLWLIILITGKRNISLAGFIRRVMVYTVQAYTYLLLLTDERSPLFPE